MIFLCFHWTLGIFSLISNFLLITAVINRTHLTFKRYSYILLLTSISDVISTVSDMFISQRVLLSMPLVAYVSYGPCRFISERVCYLGYCVFLHSHAYSVLLIAFSFWYRYGVLICIDNHGRPYFLPCALSVLYFPGFVQMVSFSFAQGETNQIRCIVERVFDYDLTNELVTGHLSMFEPLFMFTLIFIAGAPTPVFIFIAFMRAKLISKLNQLENQMSATTRKLHLSFVHALTVESLLPLTFVFSSTSYLILLLRISRSTELEHLIFLVTAIPPTFNSVVTLYFILPYRRFILEIIGIQPNKIGIIPGRESSLIK